jgi:hypothetical protein
MERKKDYVMKEKCRKKQIKKVINVRNKRNKK